MDLNKTGTTGKPEPIMKRVFKCSLLNCRFSFSNGKEAIFLGGEFLTNDRREIFELETEIDSGHPHIYVDPDKLEVDTVFRDPMDAIREKIREEIRAEAAAIAAKEKDAGSSEQGKLVVGNTTTAGDAMSGSTSSNGAPSVGTAASTSGTATVAATLGTGANTAKVITAGPKA